MDEATALNKLRKLILFSLVPQTNQDICFRCQAKIETVEKLSIEHKYHSCSRGFFAEKTRRFPRCSPIRILFRYIYVKPPELLIRIIVLQAKAAAEIYNIPIVASARREMTGISGFVESGRD